jgi:hypothetical protein
MHAYARCAERIKATNACLLACNELGHELARILGVILDDLDPRAAGQGSPGAPSDAEHGRQRAAGTRIPGSLV